MPRALSRHRLRLALVVGAALTVSLVGCVSGEPGETSDFTGPASESPAPDLEPEQTDEPTAEESEEPRQPSELPEPVEVASFDAPWAMTFLPDGQALVTDKGGTLFLVDVENGELTEVSGTPEVVDEGQGGLGDVVLAPDFEDSRSVYLSWVESGDGGTGAVVGRGELADDGTALEGLEVIWRQAPKTSGNGHFSHRMAFSPDGAHLFVTSGDRQKLDPAQDLTNTLGTIVRLNADGTAAEGNPFADQGGVTAQIWSYGHRNLLGIAFDSEGNLWSTEMGPRGGDELNLIEEGANYGWPLASMGVHYSGEEIPDHADGDGFEPPKASWVPSISPGNLMIYDGDMFPDWQGSAFIGGLSGQKLVRVELDGTSAEQVEEWDLGERIREVEQGPDGAIWLLEDEGRLVRLGT